MFKIGTCSSILLLLLTLFSCSTTASKGVLKISAASSMQHVLKELATQFTKQNAIPCQLNFSSSGKLATQIILGAPFDVFISADMEHAQQVANSGIQATVSNSYIKGKLVLWTSTKHKLVNLDSLTSSKIQHIAMANPKVAPYGKAAREVVEKIGLYEPLKKKIIYGESISQTDQFIASGAAEAGFTALSSVLSPSLKEKGSWVMIDTSMYTPLHQGIVLNSNSAHAARFSSFLKSKEARQLLKKYGYSISE